MMHLNLQVMKNRPLSELVIDFINDQDVNELSKKTYKLSNIPVCQMGCIQYTGILVLEKEGYYKL